LYKIKRLINSVLHGKNNFVEVLNIKIVKYRFKNNFVKPSKYNNYMLKH